MSIYKKLSDLNITLPELTPPVAAFVPYLRTGNLIFLSGHIAKIDGKPMGRPARGRCNDCPG
jgi:hypothetical protein